MWVVEVIGIEVGGVVWLLGFGVGGLGVED